MLLLCVSAAPVPTVAADARASAQPQGSADAIVPSGVGWDTIAGPDRYATAVAVSRAMYPEGADTVVIADGTDWPDAVGGGVLAGVSDASLLLVDPAGTPATVEAELSRLAPLRILVLGGVDSIPDALVEQLSALASVGVEVTRVAGVDRYETSAMVASETIAAAGASLGGQVFVASGRTFADALAAGPVAVATHRPVYLIDDAHAQSMVSAMRDAGVRRVTVLGGEAVVSPAAYAVLAGEFGAANVERIAGPTRYQTATRIAETAVRYYGFSLATPGLATGNGFADALACGPYLAGRRAPLLLAPPAAPADPYADWFYVHRAEIDGFTVFGGDAAVSPRTRQEIALLLVAPRFDQSRALGHVAAIADIGVRRAGSTAEREALDYVARELASYGYVVGRQAVAIPGGTSGNVLAERKGDSSEVIVLGAHIDSKYPSPGANDNASGVGTMLELARVLSQAPLKPTVRFIAFGAEEISGATPDDHHFGSRGYVSALPSSELARIAGMVSIDMVGYGSVFNVRSMGVGSPSVVYSLQGRASYSGIDMPYLRDAGRWGWSDHEPFERSGVPSAWLEWREDPVYHTSADVASHVNITRLDATGDVLRSWLLSMSAAQLSALR